MKSRAYIKRIVSLFLATIMLCQVVPINVFAEILLTVKSEEFKPAIEVDSVPENRMTDEEIQSLYEKFKNEILSDISLQKTKFEDYKEEEEKIKSVAEKSLTKEQKALLKDLSLSSLPSSIRKESLALNSSVVVPEAPQNLDAILSGDKVILTWMPSEGADGYKIYQVHETENGTETKKFKTSHSLYSGDYEVLLPDENGDYQVLLPDDKVNYTIYVKAYVLDEDGNEIESTKSNQIIVGRGDREITSSFTLNCDHVYRKVTITGGTLDLNGYKLKVFGELSQTGGEVDLNNGKLIAFNSYTISNSASLRMNDEFDYVYVGGNFFFNTSTIHNSSYLNKGILQVEGDNFKVIGPDGVFLPDGDHKVYLTSLNISGTTTVDFRTDNVSQFNILAINKPLSKYQFLPLPPVRTLPWYKSLIYLEDKDTYIGIDGAYSPIGHFGRKYTDLVIPTRGLDISIGRTYSSKNTRGGMLGVGWTFSYEGSVEVDTTGNIATFYAPDGSTMNFSIRSSSGGDKIYDGMDSRAELYYYQATDRYILETRDRTKYGFDMISGKYCMTYIEDYSGNRITIEFDTNGNIYKIRDEDGRQVTLNYSSTSIDITDTLSRTITYNLNSNGKPYTVTDANGNILYTYEYDQNGFLNSVKVTEQPGVLKQADYAVYNDIGRLEKWIDINGKESNFYYEPRQTTIIYTVDGVKRKIVEKFDECYAINEVILDDGSSRVIEYFTEDIGDVSINKYNEIKSQKDNDGNVTTYERDERGNTTKIINPDGSFRRYGYYTDEVRKDLIQWELDENNNYTYYEYSNERTLIGKYVYRIPITTQTYPTLGNLSQANSIITKYTYKSDGQIESALEPNQYGTNNKTIYEYNTNGTLKKITDPEGKSISYTYNSYGLVESEVIALNGYSTYMSTWYEYDKNGRVLRKTLCDSNTIESANNKSIERFVYDNMGRLIQKISPNIYNPSNDTLDASGMVAGDYQLANVGYRYEYKGATEKVLKEIDPEGNVYLYQYDENGNMISKTLPDSNLIGGTDCTSYRYLYDCRNRLVEVYGIPYDQIEIILEKYKYSQEYISPGHFNTSVLCKKILNPNEWVTEIKKYNYAGQILEDVKDSGPNEVKTTFEYNVNGTVKSSTDGEGYTTWYYYNTLKKPVHIWTPCEGYNGITTKYTYKRIVYDDSGNVINEAVKIDKVNATVYLGSRESIHSSAITSGFYVSTNTYYKNNKIKTTTGFNGERKQYYYDGANLLIKLEEYKDETSTNKRITEYTNNYLSKVATEKQYVRNVDIYNSGSESNDPYTIIKNYSYDKNGNLAIISEPIYQTLKMFYYDNLNRVCGECYSGYMGIYSETTSRILNWEGKPLLETNKRGYNTLYRYNWMGLLSKKIQSVTQYNSETDSYSAKPRISKYWYDLSGRLIADVSPNNYSVSMESLENIYGVPVYLFNNYNYYEYDRLGRLTEKGYVGQTKEYNTATSTWSNVQNYNYKTYTYNKNGYVVTEADEENNITQYKYTPDGKLLSVLDPENKDRNLSFTVSYEYDTLGRVVKENYIDSINSTTGKVITYEYTTQSVGSVIKTYTITKKVNLTENDGVLEINKYDLLGNLISYTECIGGVPYEWEYEYNNFGKIALSKEPYKSGGVLKQVQKKYQYNSLGMLVYVQYMMDTPTNTGDDVCDLYSYNLVSGNLLSSCRQNYNGTDAITVSSKYDKNGNLISSTDGNDVTVNYSYDELDRKVSESVIVDNVEHKDTIDYDLNGNIIRTVDWRGNCWHYYYDTMNRLYKKEDPYNTEYEKLEYDARNLQVRSYDAYNKKTDYVYDKNKRLISTEDSLDNIESRTYDNLGNIKEKIDGRNNKIVYKYDIMGRVEEVYDSTELMAKYTYYIDGTLKEQKIGNATSNYVTTYTYNPFGMVETITDPTETGVPATTENYEYYPTGNVKSKVDRNGKTTTYEYDCHGRLLKQTTGDSSNSIIITIPNTASDKGYDGNGNLKKIILEKKVSGTVVSTITTERDYDDLNRVKTKKETSVEGGITTVIGPVNYTYDIISGVLDGEVKEVSYYPGSNTVTKVYDCAGRLKSVSDGQQTDYEYDANGRRESITYNDTFKQTYTYYDNGLLDELRNLVKNSSGVYVESEYYKYYYDAAHNMTRKDERISGITKTTTYTYDSMNRLQTVTEPTKTTEYTFDSRGNRKTETVTEGSEITYTQYEYTNNNRLKYETKRNGGPTGPIKQKKQYTYDNNGNLTLITDITGTPRVITTNTYTLINQLESSTTAGNTLQNTYNAEGKRVSKTLNTGSPTRYFYEGNKTVFEYTNGGTVTAFNVIGANLISRKIGTDKVYYSYNGQGDVIALLDAVTKNKRAQYAYDAFGNVTDEKYYDSNGNITTNPSNIIKSQVRYGEYQYDSETEYTDDQGNFVTGLYYLNARHYDPGTARFLEMDTYTGDILDPLSLNLYTYCRNEPIMYTDPTGHYTQGKVFSYVEGQVQKYDPDVWELQQDLIYLGFMSREDIPAGQEGYYGPRTVAAVNKFKNKYLPGGNTGVNEGKFGDTTWLYLKREVKLKNLEGIAKNQYYATELAKVWNTFYSDYDKLVAKPKSTSSTSGNTYNYGKSDSSNQGTSNTGSSSNKVKDYLISSSKQIVMGNYTEDVTLLGTAGQIVLGIVGLDLPADIRDISADIVNWKMTPGHLAQTAIDVLGILPVVGSLKYADELGTLAKNSDEIASTIKKSTKGLDEATSTIKNSTKGLDEVAEGASKALGDLSQASKYGIDTYGNLTKSLKGTGLQAHHIIEQRLADVLGISNTKSMLSVAVTKTEHQAFTNAWRKLIPYGTNYSTLTKTQIWNYAQEVYKDYPALLDAAKKTIFK